MKIEIQERKYLHFDRPFFGGVALAAVSDPKRVQAWSFMPFLHIKLSKVRVKRQDDGSLKTDTKERPIFYAAHRDAALYFYYAEIMGEQYEATLQRLDISDCVTAFRKNTGKCNIHYANEVFHEIRKHHSCAVYTFDVKSFFENLDHKILKSLWARLLNVDALPADHFAVFKSITHYSYVDRDAVFKLFEINPSDRAAFKRRYICDVDAFREQVRRGGLIQRHADSQSGEWMKAGIPQGSPISAILSNLYMIDFDLIVAKAVNNASGMYRRYCDDIICVIPNGNTLDVVKLINDEIRKLALEIHPTKSTVHHFNLEGGSLVCMESKPVQYLGFLFDGKAIRLRTVALSRYYAKMRRGIRAVDRARMGSDLDKGAQTALKTKALHRRYTYVGRRNFVAYAHRAARIMNSQAIRRQLKPHLSRFFAYIKIKEDRWLNRSAHFFDKIMKRHIAKKNNLSSAE